jgi:hypothetical protein
MVMLSGAIVMARWYSTLETSRMEEEAATARMNVAKCSMRTRCSRPKPATNEQESSASRTPTSATRWSGGMRVAPCFRSVSMPVCAQAAAAASAAPCHAGIRARLLRWASPALPYTARHEKVRSVRASSAWLCEAQPPARGRRRADR